MPGMAMEMKISGSVLSFVLNRVVRPGRSAFPHYRGVATGVHGTRVTRPVSKETIIRSYVKDPPGAAAYWLGRKADMNTVRALEKAARNHKDLMDNFGEKKLGRLESELEFLLFKKKSMDGYPDAGCWPACTPGEIAELGAKIEGLKREICKTKSSDWPRQEKEAFDKSVEFLKMELCEAGKRNRSGASQEE